MYLTAANKRTIKRRLQRKRKKMITTTGITFADMQAAGNAFWSANTGQLGGIVPIKTNPPNAQKKGKPMCYDDYTPTVENRKLSYAQNRISALYYSKNNDLRKMFHLDEDERPNTGEELVSRIKEGKYSLKNEDDIKHIIKWSVMDYITWRDPSTKPDKAGFALALKELEEAQKSADDLVTLGDSKAALEAINDFAEWQPSNAPKSKK